ncbi:MULTISPECIES: colicin immunity protein Cui [unclassified Providencia]|uniref:colicin immunity protein Cui n=2 Tax=Morganellaceae TaxID=1903414 RepID=UPI0011DDCCA6|nr:hypothetical protein [Providencia sp. wls1938]MTC45126.1 hypothetical protein [Providencia sp. wls1922]MTC77355.1 hypothetical protein [Providencia sp. wls1916]
MSFKINSSLAFIITILLGAVPLSAIWLHMIPNIVIISISNWIDEIPVIYSDYYRNESYLSALYCKIAPVFSIPYYLVIWNSIKIKKEHFKLYNKGIITTIFGYFSIILIISMITYINYFLNYNISNGNRNLRTISAFEFTSFLYYYAIFISIFTITCAAVNAFIFLPIKYKK